MNGRNCRKKKVCWNEITLGWGTGGHHSQSFDESIRLKGNGGFKIAAYVHKTLTMRAVLREDIRVFVFITLLSYGTEVQKKN